jgi:hypothetical protein
MRKQARAIGVAAAIALAVLSLAEISGVTQACSLDIRTRRARGTVSKERGELFTATITFRNTGRTRGLWSVAVTFEGDVWYWRGNQTTLDLNPGKECAVSWEGRVPENAEVGSVARLVVYYNDSFVALDWWIHVISSETLEIVRSTVT